MIQLLCVLALISCTGTPNRSDPDSTKSKPKSTSVEPSNVNNEATKDLERLVESAKEAVEYENWEEAKTLVRRGLQQTEENRDLDMFQARFLLLKGELSLHVGDTLKARRYFTDAMAIFHVRKNDAGRFETFLALGRLEAQSGDYAAAERQFDEAKTLDGKITDKRLKAKFWVEQGRLAARTMNHKKATEFYAKALQIYDALKNNRHRAETLLLLSQEEEMLGRIGSARQSLYRASKLFDSAELPSGKVKAIHRLATFAEREKKYAVARRLYGEAIALYEQLDQQTAATSVSRHLSSLPEKSKKKKKSR